MDIRRTPTQIGEAVASAITNAGMSPAMVADAADIPSDVLSNLLDGALEFTVEQLVSVGGVLRVRPSQFLEGLAA